MSVSISMVMIARNEERNVEKCFASFWDDVDQVVLLDTGSTDKTIAKARAFARRRKQIDKLIVQRGDFGDGADFDFGAARQHADTFATGDWVTWCDLDDVVHGLDNLRLMAEQAPDDVVTFYAAYEYGKDEHGNTVSELWRERLSRAGHGQWEAPVHECKLFHDGGRIVQVPRNVAYWEHQRDHSEERSDRNCLILERWLEREPHNARALNYLAVELLGLKRYDEAIERFREFLQLPNEPPDIRSQATRLLSVLLGERKQWAEAKDVTVRAMVENPRWTDSYITLAEIAHDEGRYQEALMWCDRALELGQPQTVLVVNPFVYTVHVRAIRAGCLRETGRVDEAIQLCREVLAAAPGYLGMDGVLEVWESDRARNQTVEAVMGVAEQLMGDGEPERALQLLNAVPAAVEADPRLVSVKAAVMRVLATDWSPPTLIDSPPGRFLVNQLQEQMA